MCTLSSPQVTLSDRMRIPYLKNPISSPHASACLEAFTTIPPTSSTPPPLVCFLICFFGFSPIQIQLCHPAGSNMTKSHPQRPYPKLLPFSSRCGLIPSPAPVGNATNRAPSKLVHRVAEQGTHDVCDIHFVEICMHGTDYIYRWQLNCGQCQRVLRPRLSANEKHLTTKCNRIHNTKTWATTWYADRDHQPNIPLQTAKPF